MAKKGNILTQSRKSVEKVRLGDVVDINTSSPPKYEGVKRYISTGAVVDGAIVESQVEMFGFSERPSRADLYPKEGDVLFAKMQATRKTFVVDRMNLGSLYSTGFYALTPHKDEIDTLYLSHYLDSEQFLSAKDKECNGATQKALSGLGFKKLLIPLPSLPEQKRIAAVLDKICELKKNAEAQIEDLDLLVKSRFVEMFGDPKTNPKGWPIGRVSDLAKYWNGLTYKPENVSDRGIIVLRSSNIQGGCLDFADTVRVNISAKEKNVVEPGDILMCSRNGSAALVGKTAIIPETEERMYFGAFMMILRSEVPEYLNTYFATKAFRSQITCGATSTVNQITCSMMDDVKLSIPPKDLMGEFAAFVEKVEKLKDVAKKSVEEMDTLYRAKLQEYFG